MAALLLQPFLQTKSNEQHAELSPDGDGGLAARWGLDGSEIFFRNGKRMMVADVSSDESEESRLGKPRLLFETDLSSACDVAPDGQRLVMTDERKLLARPTELVLVQTRPRN